MTSTAAEQSNRNIPSPQQLIHEIRLWTMRHESDPKWGGDEDFCQGIRGAKTSAAGWARSGRHLFDSPSNIACLHCDYRPILK